MGSCAPWSIDRLVFVTSPGCSRWVQFLCCGWRCEIACRNPCLKQNLAKIKPVLVSHPWYKVFITTAHKCTFNLTHIVVHAAGVSSSWSLLHWCETQCTWVLTRDVVGRSLSQASCPFVLLHSAYWRASPGSGTEALTNIKAVSWCRFVKHQGAAGPKTSVASWSKSREIQKYVCSSVCLWLINREN